MHTRCCSLYFASCFAFPWDISGESVAHMAVRDSHVLAAAPPEVPAAVCTGCFLRMAEASSSPSDPLGLKAAKQVGTHDVHPAAYRNCSRPPKNPQKKTSTSWCGEAEGSLLLLRCYNPRLHSEVQHGSCCPFKPTDISQRTNPTRSHFMRTDLLWPEDRKKVGRITEINYQCERLFPTVGSSLMSRYSTTR